MAVKFLSPSTSASAIWLPPKKSPPGGHAHVEGRAPLEVELLEQVLLALVLRHHLVGDVGLEVDEVLGGDLDLLVDLLHRIRELDRLQAVLALEVADEPDAGLGAAVDGRGRGVAAQRVRVLPHRARAQVEAAHVVDVVVLGGRVVERVPVLGEVRRVVVVAAEGELRLLLRVVEREDVDLVVPADAPGVGDELAVGRDLGVGVREGVRGQVLHRARVQVDRARCRRRLP